MSDTLEFAPFRDSNDFIFESARFQFPVLNDPNRWANRVINNLLYYQTNYFLIICVLFLIVSLLHPIEMMLGGFFMACISYGALYIMNNSQDLRNIKEKHPLAVLFLITFAVYLILTVFGSVLTFLFGIACPLLIVFIHASLRMRNMKNKVANRSESFGIKKSPMGIILEAFGQERFINL